MTGKSIRSRAPTATCATVRRIMIANYGGDLRPERMLRGALRTAGLRFLHHVRPVKDLRCTADVVFPRKRVCVFVDGCFWHCCPRHFAAPKTNSRWWKEKIQATKDRDRRQRSLLRSAGWRVVRIWEHELKDIDHVVDRIARVIA